MGHNIFQLFGSKAIKKCKKNFEKNIFSLSRSRSNFLRKLLSKMTVFSRKNGNYFFTAIFAFESFIKLAAMSPRYFFGVSDHQH